MQKLQEHTEARSVAIINLVEVQRKAGHVNINHRLVDRIRIYQGCRGDGISIPIRDPHTHGRVQGCHGDGISIPIPTSYPWGSPYPWQTWYLHYVHLNHRLFFFSRISVKSPSQPRFAAVFRPEVGGVLRVSTDLA